ncbi:hypothetical protein ACK3TF_004120 [Chlorella vulgaris]
MPHASAAEHDPQPHPHPRQHGRENEAAVATHPPSRHKETHDSEVRGDNKMLWVLANAGPPALKPVLQQEATVAEIVLTPAEVQELIKWLNSGAWQLAVGAAVVAIAGAEPVR